MAALLLLHLAGHLNLMVHRRHGCLHLRRCHSLHLVAPLSLLAATAFRVLVSKRLRPFVTHRCGRAQTVGTGRRPTSCCSLQVPTINAFVGHCHHSDYPPAYRQRIVVQHVRGVTIPRTRALAVTTTKTRDSKCVPRQPVQRTTALTTKAEGL